MLPLPHRRRCRCGRRRKSTTTARQPASAPRHWPVSSDRLAPSPLIATKPWLVNWRVKVMTKAGPSQSATDCRSSRVVAMHPGSAAPALRMTAIESVKIPCACIRRERPDARPVPGCTEDCPHRRPEIGHFEARAGNNGSCRHNGQCSLDSRAGGSNAAAAPESRCHCRHSLSRPPDH
jgi:hypothetical protein